VVSQIIFGSPASVGDEGGDMMLKTTLVGKEETFRSLGIEGSHEIELDSLIAILRKQLGQENCDTEDAGKEVPNRKSDTGKNGMRQESESDKFYGIFAATDREYVKRIAEDKETYYEL